MSLSRQETEKLIVERAWKDPAFHDEFVADPKATIEKYSGQKLPAEAKILANAEDDTTIHFVIPKKPANADQLSDEDLEKVAGGIDVFAGIVIPSPPNLTRRVRRLPRRRQSAPSPWLGEPHGRRRGLRRVSFVCI